MSCSNCVTTEGIPKGCKNNGVCGTGGCNQMSVFDWLSNIKGDSSERQLVEVVFKNDRKEYYDNVNNIPVLIGDIVAVESTSGHDIGRVTLKGELIKIQMKKKKIKEEDIKKLYRKANQKDIDTWGICREKEKETMVKSRKIIHELGLSMKICDVEYQGDGSKVTFYYTADGRVDFRELIKRLAYEFKTRIDMRQIGYRQESAKVGGIGSCGRELCCATWLTDFRSVNTAAARYQQLSINPQKLAGQCGKLKCCLNFELDSYLEAVKNFPSNQTILKTEKGEAYCIKIDVFKQKMWFSYTDNSFTWYDLGIDQVKSIIALNKKNQLSAPLEDYIIKDSHHKELSMVVPMEDKIDRFENKNRNQKRYKKYPPKNNNKPK